MDRSIQWAAAQWRARQRGVEVTAYLVPQVDLTAVEVGPWQAWILGGAGCCECGCLRGMAEAHAASEGLPLADVVCCEGLGDAGTDDIGRTVYLAAPAVAVCDECHWDVPTASLQRMGDQWCCARCAADPVAQW